MARDRVTRDRVREAAEFGIGCEFGSGRHAGSLLFPMFSPSANFLHAREFPEQIGAFALFGVAALVLVGVGTPATFGGWPRSPSVSSSWPRVLARQPAHNHHHPENSHDWLQPDLLQPNFVGCDHP